jgi:hypothetical protein
MGSGERRNENSDSINGRNILQCVTNCKDLKKVSFLWNLIRYR